MSTPADRGWGPGWPDCQLDKTTVITVVGSAFRVRAETAALWRSFLTAFHATVEALDIDAITDDWSWACRAVRGSTTTPSDHSWGLAVDLNAPRHPLGKRGTFTAAQVRAIRLLLARPEFRHLRWGGDYTSRADEMHFYYAGTPANAVADTKLLKGEANMAVDDDLRRVLNEGTAKGQSTWAGTSKATLAAVQTVANSVNAVAGQVKNAVEGIARLATGQRELHAAVEALDARVTAAISTGALPDLSGVVAQAVKDGRLVSITIQPTDGG